MKKLKRLSILSAISLMACHKKVDEVVIKTPQQAQQPKEMAQPITQKISAENLPNEIKYEGEIKEIAKIIDSKAQHLVILTETGTYPNQKSVNYPDAVDFKLFVYDYVYDKMANKYQLNWKTQDFISDCEFDLYMGFIKNTFRVSDLNKNGIAEIWTMYSMTCTSDVSPSTMKIIMHEGKQKFALRGDSRVMLDSRIIGGGYKMDESLMKGDPKIKEFAIKLWHENNENHYN